MIGFHFSIDWRVHFFVSMMEDKDIHEQEYEALVGLPFISSRPTSGSVKFVERGLLTSHPIPSSRKGYYEDTKLAR